MGTVVLCNPGTLSQDLGMMEGVLVGQLLQVVPSITGDPEQICEGTCLPILSILARISQVAKERLVANLLVEWICKQNICKKKTSHYFYVWASHAISHPITLNIPVDEKNQSNLYNFSDSAYLFTTVFYVSHTLSWPCVYISVCWLSERTHS